MRVALLVAIAAEAVLLLAASRFGDFTQRGAVLKFVPLMLAAAVCFAAAVILFAKAKPAREGVVFWSVAVGLRLVMLPCAPADDFWRFGWEGRLQLNGFNPYVLAPNSPELLALRDPTWSRINHPDSAAIYPPAAELFFALIACISTAPLFFKAIFIFADLLTVAILLRLLCGATSAAAWYAWNPAVIYAFAGGAHYDSLMLLFMTAALWALQRAVSANGQQPIWRWSIASCALLGVAIALKMIPVFLVPAWICALRTRMAALIVAAAIPLLLTLPFGGLMTVLEPLEAFTRVTRFNDLVWWAVEALTIPNPYQRNWPFTLVLCIAIVAIAIRFRSNWRRVALWSLGLALVLSPVLHPWYVTWILPVACWCRAHVWSVLSVSTLSALLLWETTALWSAWQPNLLTRSFVILPPALFLIWSRSRERQPEPG